MKINLKYLLGVCCMSLILLACKKTTSPNFHFEYFGLEEGRYVIYDVVEITHDAELDQHDTLRYQLKTKWSIEYEDNEGRPGREYHVFQRATSTDPWVLTDVWYGLYDGIRAELVEENVRRVKLVFSPSISKEWDANAYNMEDVLDCYYRDIHGDTLLNGVSFDSTVVVEQASYGNLIDSLRMYEMYAKHIGLIYKHVKDNVYEIGETEVSSGKELYMTYVSSGIE